MAKKNKKFVLRRHGIVFRIMKPFARLIFFFKFGYRVKSQYRIKRNHPVIVLSNHQADLDPFFVEFAFNTFIYPIASDHMFSSKRDRVQNFFYPSIPKRKGAFDVRCALLMKKTINQGGSLLLFPEGNRAYAEFQFPIDDSIAKMRHYRTPIILFNLHGGTGVNPRFGGKIRKGKFYGEIKRILQPEEYDKMSEHEFAEIVRNELRVFDSESGEKYKSDTRAEFLERVFFLCPKCGKIETLHSEGAYLHCTNCGLKVEYTEDLHLKSDDPDFHFTKMVEWWNLQKKWVHDYQPKGDEVIFDDLSVELTTRNPYEAPEFISIGEMTLTPSTLTIGDKTFAVKDIESASPLKGNRFLFSVDGKSYHAQGDDRFNPVKYAFMLYKLDTRIKELIDDKMFSSDD